jgi:hypothetical protein
MPFKIAGKSYTHVLKAANQVGGLIADVDTLLDTERDPAEMASLLDERSILYVAQHILVGSMTMASEAETRKRAKSVKLRA